MRPGRERNALITIAVVGLIILFFAPQVLELFAVLKLTTAISLVILALSLGLIWGYAMVALPSSCWVLIRRVETY